MATTAVGESFQRSFVLPHRHGGLLSDGCLAHANDPKQTVCRGYLNVGGSRDARANVRQCFARTFARVRVTMGPGASVATFMSRKISRPRHLPSPLISRSRTCHDSSASRQAVATGDERRNWSSAMSSSHTARTARRRRSTDGPVLRPLPVPINRQNCRPFVC